MIIVGLLTLQSLHHLLDHSDDLLEADFLAAEGEGNEVQLGAIAGDGLAQAALEGPDGQRAHLALRHLDLHQARRRGVDRALEQLECIVIVQNLDGLRQSDELVRARLAALFPLRRLSGAALLQLGLELPVGGHGLLGVTLVVLHLRDRHSERADPRRLRLNRLAVECLLVLLRRHELLVRLDRGLFRGRGVGVARGHLVGHLLEDADDLPALRRILGLVLGGQECKQSLPVTVVAAGARKLAQDIGGVGLQERASHALFQSLDCLVHRGGVRSELGLESRVCSRLLLADAGGLGHGPDGVVAVALMLLEVLLGLRLLLRGLLDVRAEGGDLGISRGNAGVKVLRASSTPAHEFIIQLFLLLALFGDLRLHLLEEVHNSTNRVHRRLALQGAGPEKAGGGEHKG
mmetsp:Transcript_66842/g.193562  ORF Transcript_66842/g.193562 Transcript_66842/m.193562 type:complete len:404 (+) Transcript_66842:337-1548(+)